MHFNKIVLPVKSSVFPADRLPESIVKYPCGFVASTDPSSKPGTHWIPTGYDQLMTGESTKRFGGNILTTTGLMWTLLLVLSKS